MHVVHFVFRLSLFRADYIINLFFVTCMLEQCVNQANCLYYKFFKISNIEIFIACFVIDDMPNWDT